MRKDRKKKGRISPVLVVVLLIVLIAAAGVVSFLVQRYTPSRVQMDRNAYFQVTGDTEAALVLNGSICEEKGVMIQGELYASSTFVSQQLNSAFYWDQESQAVLLTIPAGVMRIAPGDATYSTAQGQPAVQTGADGTVYIAMEYVQQYTDMDYAFYTEPNRAVMRTEWDGLSQVEVTADASVVRYRGGIKSDILTGVSGGDPLYYLESLENWVHVMTQDGYTGYIEKEDVSEAQEAPVHVQDASLIFTGIKRDYKINLAWHQTTSQEANAAFGSVTANMKGVNVISPTWFSVLDNTGTLSSLASADYVNQAHAAGLEVWGLIDNFNENFSTETALASYSVRTNIINQLIFAAQQTGLDGINVDFEQLTEASIPHYIQFLRELSAAAHGVNLVVSVDTAVPQSFTEYYNRGEQAKTVDYMIMMGYDEHYAGSEEAGSVASLPFVEAGIQTMLEDIPADKIICAIPFYTRLWTETFGQVGVTSEVLGMDGADQYVAQLGMTKTWDASVGQNVAMAETDTARYTIWMEDEQSIEEKMKLIANYGLAGVAEWKLGFERATVWDIIAKYIAQ